MVQDKEFEIRMQFLEEATEYLNIIETKILGLATTQINHERMDAVLRAAHSIKGGAAMMGFETLSELAHRLEDFFKVLQTQKPHIDSELETLLLVSGDRLRQVIACNKQGTVIDEQWLESKINPVFEQLHQRLGEPTPADTATLLAPEGGQDMVGLIFETEVEEYLQRLESVLADANQPDLLTEVSAMAEELAGLGEMLEINAFTSLCESISQHLKADPSRVEEIARRSLQQWRRSQAAILVGQVETLPQQLDLAPAEALATTEDKINSITSQLIAVSSDHQVAATNSDHENTVRVPIKLLDQLNDLFGELTIERSGLNVYLERLRNLVKNLSRHVRNLQGFNPRLRTAEEKTITEPIDIEPKSYHPQPETSIELPEDAITNVIRIQEVTEDIELSLEDTDQTVRELNRTAKQLQTSLTQVRMRPFSDLVGRFPRFLRELSLQQGKNVELKIYGDKTLIDRTILEALNDPLTHLLRNAFAHGIEDPATRSAQGKPEQGVIEIKANSRANQTLITIKDDGGGINLDKIRQQAQQRGFDATAIANANESELLNLIFEPGFSTVTQVTNLSGRGVGLDVVRTNIRQIRGDIKVETQLGIGTTFTLSVPLTLSVARVLLGEIKGMPLAFPSDAIAEMMLLNPKKLLTIGGKEVISWKGYMLPLIRLGDWLQFRGARQPADANTSAIVSEPAVVIVTDTNEWVGIQIDRCWGEQEVAVRMVEGTQKEPASIAMPPGFTGCTILGDGRVAPLVNTPDLLRWIASCQSSSQSKQTLRTARIKSQKDTILVVDDSINVRRFLSLNLEKTGYLVEQAQDGQDALEKLLNGLEITAVICDIDMPRLDGYGLLAQIKSNPTLAHLPIIMVSSRNGYKDRQLAASLGAVAYFSKPYNQQELLQHLQQLLHK